MNGLTKVHVTPEDDVWSLPFYRYCDMKITNVKVSPLTCVFSAYSWGFHVFLHMFAMPINHIANIHYVFVRSYVIFFELQAVV